MSSSSIGPGTASFTIYSRFFTCRVVCVADVLTGFIRPFAWVGRLADATDEDDKTRIATNMPLPLLPDAAAWSS